MFPLLEKILLCIFFLKYSLFYLFTLLIIHNEMPEKAHENSSFQKKFTVLENINVGSISCVDK